MPILSRAYYHPTSCWTGIIPLIVPHNISRTDDIDVQAINDRDGLAAQAPAVQSNELPRNNDIRNNAAHNAVEANIPNLIVFLNTMDPDAPAASLTVSTGTLAGNPTVSLRTQINIGCLECAPEYQQNFRSKPLGSKSSAFNTRTTVCGVRTGSKDMICAYRDSILRY